MSDKIYNSPVAYCNSLGSSCGTGSKDPIKDVFAAAVFPPSFQQFPIRLLSCRLMEQTVVSCVAGLPDKRNLLRPDQDQLWPEYTKISFSLRGGSAGSPFT